MLTISLAPPIDDEIGLLYAGDWVTRYSSLGHPFQEWMPRLPRIPDELLDIVVYLYPDELSARAGERAGGTGFMVGVPLADTGRYLTAIVSNSHVVKDGNTTVRMNTRGGEIDVATTDERVWIHHPDGDDVAIYPCFFTSAHKLKFLSTESFATRDVIQEEDVGPGDDVIIVGRFVNREGKQRNLPSVRFGTIAQMPWEPIINDDGSQQEAYLVEGRSIAGYSGSPVLLFIGNHLGATKRKVWQSFLRGPWLLGINYCHIFSKDDVRSRITGEKVNDWYVRSNTGMLGVVPVWKIIELLETPKMKEAMDETIAQIRAASAISSSGVERDSAAPEVLKVEEVDEESSANPSHREDFMRLADAAAKNKPD